MTGTSGIRQLNAGKPIEHHSGAGHGRVRPNCRSLGQRREELSEADDPHVQLHLQDDHRT